ncbi:MAG: archaellin/type IV pilin N-terminal domain-containing protein, partial [Candidatus Aenigmatarchaeota archaeon]
MLERKGISPLIAVTLLVAITLSAALLASTFFQSVTQSITGETTDKSKRVSESTRYNLDIARASQDLTRNNAEVVLKNSGDKINENITITLFCSGENFQKDIIGLNATEVKVVTFDKVGCNVKRVQASLTEHPVSDETEDITSTGSNTFTITKFENLKKTATNVLFDQLRLGQSQTSDSESS